MPPPANGSSSVLQLMHLMRHRGLSEIELLRRRGEAAALNHFDERPELVETKAAHDYNNSLSL